MPPKRALAILCLIGLVSAFLWLTYGEQSDGAHEAPEPPSATEGTEVGEPAPVGAPGRREVPSPPPDLSGDGTAADSPTGVDILVREVAGDPIAGASVAFDTSETRPEAKPPFDAAYSRDREARAWARPIVTTGVDGRARIEAPTEDGWLVWVRDGTPVHTGKLWIPVAKAREGVQEIVVRLDFDLHVKVVDVEDRPVADVELMMTDAGEGSFVGNTIGKTGTEGVCSIEHAQVRIGDAWSPSVVVAANVPMRPHPHVVFDRTTGAAGTAADPLVIRLPEYGSVRVNLVDTEGRPVDTERHAVTARISMRELADVTESHGGFVDSVLELPFVQLGRRIQVIADSVSAFGSTEFEGPRTAGKTVTADLVVAVSPLVAGRLVDTEGKPLEGEWFAYTVSANGDSARTLIYTKADGRFEVAVPSPSRVAADVSRVLAIEPMEFDPLRLGQADVTGVVRGATPHDVGDVVLGPAPLLARGRVVDASGEGVAGARISFRIARPGSDPTSGSVLRRRSLRTDADGSFEVRAAVIPVPYRVTARLGRRSSDPREFLPGVEDLICELPSVGGLRLPFEIGEGLLPSDLEFVLTSRADGERRVQSGIGGPDTRHVSWSGLPPGAYSLSIGMAATTETLRRLDDVRVVADEETELPLERFDAVLHEIDVEVVDAEGTPVPRGHIVLDPDMSNPQRRLAFGFTQGRVTIRTPKLPVDLMVLARQCRREFVRGVEADCRVTLRRGIPVEIELSADGLSQPVRSALTAMLRGVDPAATSTVVSDWDPTDQLSTANHNSRWLPHRDHHLWAWNTPPGMDGRVTLFAPGPGHYEVEWILLAFGARRLGPASRHQFAVLPDEESKVVRVTLTPEDLR